jgi:hypothetical protein
MDQRIITSTVAALALVAIYGNAVAQPSGLFRTAAAVLALDATGQLINPREVIAPPSDIDRDMAITPPHTGAHMPIVTLPETPGGRFGIQR